uniref:Uncharacterized protein n=1 Tax=Glossina austeni TaxID=7395 RepID=A0A1A9VUI3_GLOAU
MYHMDNPHYTLSNRTTNIAQQNQVNALNVLQWHLRQLSEKKQHLSQDLTHDMLTTRIASTYKHYINLNLKYHGCVISFARVVRKKYWESIRYPSFKLFVVRLADTAKPPSPQNHDYNNNLKLKMKCIAL